MQIRIEMTGFIQTIRNTLRINLFPMVLCLVLFTTGIFLYISSVQKQNSYRAEKNVESFVQDIVNEFDEIHNLVLLSGQFPDNEIIHAPLSGYSLISFSREKDSITFLGLSNTKFTSDEIVLAVNSQSHAANSDSLQVGVISMKDGFFQFAFIRSKRTPDKYLEHLLIRTIPLDSMLSNSLRKYEMLRAITVLNNGKIIPSTLNLDCIDQKFLEEHKTNNSTFRFNCNNTNYLGFRATLIQGVEIFVVSDRSLAHLFPFMLLLTVLFIVALLAIFLYFSHKYYLQKQIVKINKAVEAISNQDFEQVLNEEYGGVLGNLATSINNMGVHLKGVYENLELRVIRRTSEISIRNAELRAKQKEILKQNHELKSAYDALKESREKYEKLIEHLEEEYIFYSQAINGDLLFVSPSVKKILGFDVKEFRKQYSTLYTNNTINDMARHRSENLRSGIAQPKYLKEIFDKNNIPKILEVTEIPIFNEDEQLVSIEGLAHDITEKQHAEELIKEQEEKYRMLFAYASDFIIMYEIDTENQKMGNIIEANFYTLEKLGYTIEELREKSPIEIEAVEFWDGEGGVPPEYGLDDVKYERIWESKEGCILNVEISSHSFKIRERTVAIAVARDITERKKAEEEIIFINEELYNQKENLEALVDNLTQTQEQLVQSEKMAALGQLIAGIAHEINTPLGAIKASIGNLDDSLESALTELPTLLQHQSTENLKLFSLLFELAKKKSPELSTREKRQLKREITTILNEHNITQSDSLADVLVYMEIHHVDDRLIEYMKMPESMQVVRSVRNFFSLLKNTNTINIAVEKATKVVFALKKYAHRDSMGEKVSTDIIDSIETVLTLYNNQLKQGVEVVRNYGKLPLVHCYQDEMSQVWTNLIQNAIQAMKQEGTLVITTLHHENMVHISFKDTGPGIEPDIKGKIFEPFFTTKKQGEGSGLGLDIVKKIIDKHEGSIELESELGKGANFIIKIPVN